MNTSIPTLDRQAPVIDKPLSFSEQAQQLHRKCDRIITSIHVKRELLAEAISEGNDFNADYLGKQIDSLYRQYRETFFELIQPIIEKSEQ